MVCGGFSLAGLPAVSAAQIAHLDLPLAGVAVGLCPDEAATPAPLKSPRREARSFPRRARAAAMPQGPQDPAG